MFKTFIDFFKNKDIRKRILVTLLILFIYRLGASIPAPGIDSLPIKISANTILGMMNLLGGGSIEQMSIFSLGVGPYITASIIIELLAMDIIPPLAEMAKSGKKGRQQMDRITRYLGIAMGLVQGYFIVMTLSKQYNLVENPGFSSYAYIAVIFTAGTMFLLWLADKITQYGIGNGTSMIIFAGIVADMPNNWKTVFNTFIGENATSSLGVWGFVGYCVMYLAIIVLVVVMQLAERRIPIQQSSSRALNKTKGDLNHIPLKINSASVTPVIFASALIQGPLIITSWVNNDAYTWLSNLFDFSKPGFLCFYAALIILFTFFYTNLTIDPQKMADDLGKNGQYIPGVRPGSETKDYVSKVLNRITVLGAILLTFIAILPYVTALILKAFGTDLGSSLAVGGTGIILVVGIAMDTVKEMKGMLTSKQYKSFVGK